MEHKASTATIVRTVCLALALVNQLLSAGGHSVIPHRQRDREPARDRWG